jgi:hypothetical protein
MIEVDGVNTAPTTVVKSFDMHCPAMGAQGSNDLNYFKVLCEARQKDKYSPCYQGCKAYHIQRLPPVRPHEFYTKLAKLLDSEISKTQIAKKMGVSRGTIDRHSKFAEPLRGKK